MNVEISLQNQYFPWREEDTGGIKCWLKGTLIYKNELLRSVDVVHLFSSVLKDPHNESKVLKTLLLALNGNFALVVETPQYIFCTVDHIRSIPLFYAKTEERFIFSDDANGLRDRLDPPFNEENGAEFLVAGFVTGSETLFDGISQLQAGEYLVYDKKGGSITTSYYHRFWHGDFFSDPKEDLLNRLDEIFVRAFQRLVASTKGLQIVVLLSGGLDSRIIVAMLKRLGVDDVICFSYGKKGSTEVEIGRQVAEALGYRWYFVEYTHEGWYNCYHSDEMKDYMKYAGNLCSLPHIQDFLAVRYLKNEGLLPSNSVLVPGHGGHIPGSVLLDHGLADTDHQDQDTILCCLKSHYNLWEYNREQIQEYFCEKIAAGMEKNDIDDIESYANVIELFNFKERQAKFIQNSIRLYEFFNFRWALPLCDGELLKLFSHVPLEFRIGKWLYKKYAKEILFRGVCADLQDIPCTTRVRNFVIRDLSFSIQTFLLRCLFITEIGKDLYTRRKVRATYDAHPLAWYGIFSRDRFMRMYSGTETINSFLGVLYIKDICPSSWDALVEKYLVGVDRFLPEL